MPEKVQSPQIKISPAAKKHIDKVVRTLKDLGFSASIVSEASEAILSIPMPTVNGNGSKPAPVEAGKEPK